MTDLPKQHAVPTLTVIPDPLLQSLPAAAQLPTETVEAEKIRGTPAHHFHINCLFIGGKTNPALPADMMFHLHNTRPVLYQPATQNYTVRRWYRNSKSFLMYAKFLMLPAVIKR